MRLTGDEYYVDGMSQEFSTLYLTNKRIIHRNSVASYVRSTWNYGWERDLFPAASTGLPSIPAKKIVTPTAYTMIIEDTFGKYWLCVNDSSNYVLNKPVSYTFFDQLKSYLLPIREATK
jgi:hypothetical protein